jgi:hypothetical protein
MVFSACSNKHRMALGVFKAIGGVGVRYKPFGYKLVLGMTLVCSNWVNGSKNITLYWRYIYIADAISINCILLNRQFRLVM